MLSPWITSTSTASSGVFSSSPFSKFHLNKDSSHSASSLHWPKCEPNKNKKAINFVWNLFQLRFFAAYQWMTASSIQSLSKQNLKLADEVWVKKAQRKILEDCSVLARNSSVSRERWVLWKHRKLTKSVTQKILPFSDFCLPKVRVRFK